MHHLSRSRMQQKLETRQAKFSSICWQMFVGNLQSWLVDRRTTRTTIQNPLLVTILRCDVKGSSQGKRSLFYPFKSPPKTTHHWGDIYCAIIKYLWCLQAKKVSFVGKHGQCEMEKNAQHLPERDSGPKHLGKHWPPAGHQLSTANHIHGCDMLNSAKCAEIVFKWSHWHSFRHEHKSYVN